MAGTSSAVMRLFWGDINHTLGSIELHVDSTITNSHCDYILEELL